jgi:fumarylacetoacetase
MTDATHDPGLRSWVESANAPDCDFPIQNLPFARFRRRGRGEPWRIGVAIGDQIVDLALARQQVPWSNEADELLALLGRGDLYALMTQPAQVRRRFRLALSQALEARSLQGPFLEFCLVPQEQAEYALPCRTSDYTDFYTGIHHATTVGRLLRPDNPLLPNYKWVPIGYHGRASSLRVGPHEVQRPWGQIKPADAAVPQFAPSRRLDYELELGAYVALPNALGEPVGMDQAEEHLFGLVLLNDWSARDVQTWEYQPLGPFLSKSFATTLSPWVVTMEALEPFRVPFVRPEGDPAPLPYLDSQVNRARGAIAITLQAWLHTAAMRTQGLPPQQLSQAGFADSYWTLAQLLTHHTSNGCNLQAGDLLGTGTQSGPGPDQGGSLLELSQGGQRAITLASGEQRTFLEDGDTIILRGHCAREGAARIGFGDCVATVAAARSGA